MLLVHKMLTKTSEDCPNKVAIVHKNKCYTYCELEAAAAKVAAFLLSKGVVSGDRIGIFSSKCIEEITAIFAVLKIGCIFVHINPHLKENQLVNIVSDCDMKVMFVHNSKAKIFNKSLLNNKINMIVNLSPENSLVQHDLIFDLESILKGSTIPLNFDRKIEANDPAAIIYTSGSTGKSKGVVVTHKIFNDATVTSAQIFENNAEDRLISVTAFSFDGALSQLFTTVLVGGTLVLQDSIFPRDIVNTMLNERITGFHAVPSFWRMMLKKYSPFDRFAYPYLRYVSIIGEVFPQNELLKLRKVLYNKKFFMMYGITEAFRSTYLPADDFERKITSVGKPFPGVEIMIVDDNSKRCRSGQVGEIVHKGAFVSPGYWNEKKMTGKVFKDGCFYTGDLGKVDDEGLLYFVGRKDHMIKSMGFRISPQEIEECLCNMTNIHEVAVLGVPNEEYGQRIKAVLVPEPGSSLSQSAVINYCKTHLPHYMVPNVVEFQNNLQRTGTLKINKSQLV
jgi:amino acid adenylation domain-containing protein